MYMSASSCLAQFFTGWKSRIWPSWWNEAIRCDKAIVEKIAGKMECNHPRLPNWMPSPTVCSQHLLQGTFKNVLWASGVKVWLVSFDSYPLLAGSATAHAESPFLLWQWLKIDVYCLHEHTWLSNSQISSWNVFKTRSRMYVAEIWKLTVSTVTATILQEKKSWLNCLAVF